MVGELESRLCDYHACFNVADVGSIEGNLDVLLGLKYAHLETEEEMAAVAKEEAERLIKSSVRAFYTKLAQSIATSPPKAAGGTDGQNPATASAAALAELTAQSGDSLSPAQAEGVDILVDLVRRPLRLFWRPF
eukprot:COSAG01_NODE_2803_length_7047_cov_19.196891_8_plen_134_part_00